MPIFTTSNLTPDLDSPYHGEQKYTYIVYTLKKYYWLIILDKTKFCWKVWFTRSCLLLAIFQLRHSQSFKKVSNQDSHTAYTILQTSNDIVSEVRRRWRWGLDDQGNTKKERQKISLKMHIYSDSIFLLMNVHLGSPGSFLLG